MNEPLPKQNEAGPVARQGSRRYEGATAATALLIGLALTLVFLWTREATGLGLDFKIFFFHVPAAWLMLLSAMVAGVAAARSLLFHEPDHLAASAVDLAVLFGVIVLVTGPLWAWRAWGKPWVWEPRLTTSLVCWLTYAVALVVRGSGPAGARTALLLALLGAFEVPLVYLSVRWWAGGHHPPTSLVPTLSGRYAVTLLISIIAASGLWGLLLNLALRYRKNQSRLIRIEALAKALDRSGLVPVFIAAFVVASPLPAKATPLEQPHNRIQREMSHPSRHETSDSPRHKATRPGAGEGFLPYPAQGTRTDEGPTRGTIAAVLAAYLAFWAVLFLYLVLLAHKNRAIEDRIEALERRLDASKTETHEPPGNENRDEQRRTG